VQQIEALEREDFSRIAAPIYGRGFVKLYCEALGLDPQPLVAEFMEIYSGNRQPAIKMRPTANAPAQPPPSEPVPSAAPLAAEPGFDAPPTSAAEPETTPEPETQPEPEAVPEPETPPPQENEVSAADQPAFSLESETVRAPSSAGRTATFEPEQPAFADEVFSSIPKEQRYWHSPTMADDYVDDGFRLSKIPKSVWRTLILAVVAAMLLWLVISGVRALYRATMQTPTEDENIQTAESPSKKESPPTTAPETQTDAGKPQPAPTARKPMKLPPLYID